MQPRHRQFYKIRRHGPGGLTPTQMNLPIVETDTPGAIVVATSTIRRIPNWGHRGVIGERNDVGVVVAPRAGCDKGISFDLGEATSVYFNRMGDPGATPAEVVAHRRARDRSP